MVIAAASTVLAAVAFAVALLRDSPSEPAEDADAQQVGDEVAEARAESDAATEAADAAMVIAEEAAARAARAEEALAAALAEPGGAVAPDVIARLEAELEEVRNLAAAALVAADAPSSAEDPVAGDATGDDGDGSEEAPASEDAAEDEPAAEEEPATEEEAASEEEPASGSGDPSDDEPVAEDDEAADLPGEPFEYAPSVGAALYVVGVPHGDVLNVRHLPAGDIVGTLDPVSLAGGRAPYVIVRDADGETLAEPYMSTAVTATGLARQLPTTVWYQHEAAGVTGWSSAAYLAQFGTTDDVTGRVLAALGETVTDETMDGLARRVVDVITAEDPPSRVVVTAGAVVDEGVGAIGVDLIGLPDDSLLGYRLVVSAAAAGDWMAEDDPGPYTLTHVGLTAMCRRGVSEEGLCI